MQWPDNHWGSSRSRSRRGSGAWLPRLAIVLLATMAPVAAPASSDSALPCATPPAGEFGGDLAFLARCCTGPAAAGTGNYFVDLWEETGFRGRVCGSGLTNNRALFINAHGTALSRGTRRHYAFVADERRLAPGQPVPHYSVADLARVLGPDRAAGIHNIIVGGCNEEGAFRAKAFRAHFVNATNITHAAAGELGCQPMLLQALMTESTNVQSIYESPWAPAGSPPQWITTADKPSRSSVRYRPYLAELFRPGAVVPFKIQVAGRELLDPTPLVLPDLATLFVEDAPEMQVPSGPVHRWRPNELAR